ncbi:hypothetical protein DXV76_12700 [Rhodobacteraceae bacterium CCMM004]|nr:hypothetical protein DXV76_12700 [Rhodobacteraceae bacterium CCMM004]
MRALKWILGVVLALAAVFVVGGLLLPREVTVARSATVQAPPEAVFPHVNSLRQTMEWSPWLSRDPETEVTFSGPESGVGAAMSWSSDDPQVGQGSQEIVASTENREVVTALDFGAMGTAEARFLLRPEGDETQVTWTLDTDMGAGPMGRWMGLMMDRWVGADYDRGLANLKARVEGAGS